MEFEVKKPSNNNNTCCCVPNCNSTAKRDRTVSFHHFPKRNERKVRYTNNLGIVETIDCYQAWVLRLRMGKAATKYMRVCSLHFTKQDYVTGKSPGEKILRRCLKRTAVPSLNLPLVQVRKPRKPPKKRLPTTSETAKEYYLGKMEEDKGQPWKFHTCKFCSYRSKSAFVMCNHMRRHQTRSKTDTFTCALKTPEMFECEICQFGTNLKVDLTEHFRVFHEEKEANEQLESIFTCHRCKNCDFETHSMLLLTKHVSDCNNVFRNSWDKEHLAYQKQNNENFGNIKRFKCDQCAYKAKAKNNLRHHIAMNHTNNLQTWFKCDQCAYKAMAKNNLRHHIAINHTNNSQTWFKCDQCAYKANVKNNLRNHIAMNHTNNSQIWFTCDQCPYKTVHKPNLKRHALTHANSEDINWFKCDRCEFKTKIKFDLNRHAIRRHVNSEDVNWFKCEHCEFKTKTKYYLKRHATIIHKHIDADDIKCLKCHLCEFKTTIENDLRKHTIIKHTEALVT